MSSKLTVDLPAIKNFESNSDSSSDEHKKIHITPHKKVFTPHLQTEDTETVPKEYRKIFINQPNENHHYRDNAIHTNKYTLLTFIPKNLYEQFKRAANFYFLCIAILQCIPGLSPINPVSSIAPLIFVLAVTAIKEAVEDYKRNRQDQEINHRKTEILEDGKWKEVNWKDVKVGNIIRLRNGNQTPVDFISLSTSEPDGVSSVETANLDGETNLKVKNSLRATAHLTKKKQLSELRAVIDCGVPDNRLYEFDGKISIDGEHYPITPKEVLLRGCIVKNIKWMAGAVVYTGSDTKLMQNSTKPPSKRSTLEVQMNRVLLVLFIILLATCIISVIIGRILLAVNGTELWYLSYQNSNFDYEAFISFWTFLIIFNVIIPISLYVTMEMVKIIHAYLIENDLQMYHEETDTPARARTSNLSEELGQISYIFSDKTGTLTRNMMEFLKCSISGKSYGNGLTEIAIARAKREGREINIPEHEEPLPGVDPTFPFKDKTFLKDLKKGGKYSKKITEFMRCLAVCHSVVIEQDKPEDEDADPAVRYQASSPDEDCLVKAAKELGFYFHTQTSTGIIVNELGDDRTYEILNMNEFNSDRKRMSVIARLPNGKIRLYIKGADVKIEERLDKSNKNNNKTKNVTWDHLVDYAADGLRTLVLAYRDISDEEYDKWNETYYEASISLEGRAEKMERVAEEIEKDLILLGATAIEDKLQEGVPSSIEKLANANLKIWVLTGDKQETAINIGYACSLLTEQMDVLVVNSSTLEETIHKLQKAHVTLDEKKQQGQTEFGLVIDGNSLNYGLLPDLEETLLALAQYCKAVICCRVTPIQKAQVVSLVKNHLKTRTLSIGDGANDVSMLQAAHIGVGISGKEGMQAVLASDYAIAQFRYLERLILVHGRWNYKRIALLVLYSFYKNMAFAMVSFWFQIAALFSGQTLYDSWYITVYNVICTSLPIIWLAVLNQDVSEEYALKFPQLYKSGQIGEEFGVALVSIWLLEGFYQSFVIYFGVYLLFQDGILDPYGRELGMWAQGNLAYTIVVITVTIKVALYTTYWHWSSFIIIIGSVVAFFAFAAIYSAIPVTSIIQEYVLNYQLWATGGHWIGILVIVAVAIIPGLVIKYIVRQARPKTVDIIAELEQLDRKVPGPVKVKIETKFKWAKINIIGKKKTKSQFHTGFAFDAGEAEEKRVMTLRKKKKAFWKRKPKKRSEIKLDVPNTSEDKTSSHTSEGVLEKN